mmetsp:Transcript_88018/g.251147  ORF Transcript_88018/g.251147 Transcript_88018/m.251147 type:complete len:273 (+) Transcript_88018:207-1025(+)
MHRTAGPSTCRLDSTRVFVCFGVAVVVSDVVGAVVVAHCDRARIPLVVGVEAAQHLLPDIKLSHHRLGLFIGRKLVTILSLPFGHCHFHRLLLSRRLHRRSPPPHLRRSRGSCSRRPPPSLSGWRRVRARVTLCCCRRRPLSRHDLREREHDRLAVPSIIPARPARPTRFRGRRFRRRRSKHRCLLRRLRRCQLPHPAARRSGGKIGLLGRLDSRRPRPQPWRWPQPRNRALWRRSCRRRPQPRYRPPCRRCGRRWPQPRYRALRRQSRRWP